MALNFNVMQILIISFLFLTAFNCFVTYFCSSSSLKVLEETKSYPKAINKIRAYDKYLLTTLTLITSAVYVILSYFYFRDLLVISDYFISLSTALGFVLALLTTFFSRLCYCYACNVLLKTKLNEYECFIENFFYLLRIFFPIFLISFVIPTIQILPIAKLYREIFSVSFIVIYLVIWVFSSPGKTILTLNAREIRSTNLLHMLNTLFIDNGIKSYKLYYWDSSKSNESNAFISGFFKRYLFISSTLIETLDDKELMAIVLHEIGHVKHHHLNKILISKLALLSVLSLIIYYVSVFRVFNIGVLFALVFSFILVMGRNLKGMKKYEDQADLYVNKSGYGKELISALKKISFDNSDVMSKLDEFLSSHPDVNKRIEKLKKK